MKRRIKEVLEAHREIDHRGEDVPYWKDCSCGASSLPYVDHVAEAIAEEVLAALRRLDGTPRSAVSLITGFSYAELDDLGGFRPDNTPTQ